MSTNICAHPSCLQRRTADQTCAAVALDVIWAARAAMGRQS